MSYTKGEAFIGKDHWSKDKQLVIQLPHSCDEWVIGGKDEALQLIADVQTLISELTEVESIDA